MRVVRYVLQLVVEFLAAAESSIGEAKIAELVVS